jgi:hypothetical protein
MNYSGAIKKKAQMDEEVEGRRFGQQRSGVESLRILYASKSALGCFCLAYGRLANELMLMHLAATNSRPGAIGILPLARKLHLPCAPHTLLFDGTLVSKPAPQRK